MDQPGRDSPVKEVKDTNPATWPKWVFRLPNARRKLKRVVTPHPAKAGGNTKRDALVSLTETGRARKKIVFEVEEPAAGIDGGTYDPAGVGEVSSPVSSPAGDRKGGRWTRKARPGPFEALHLSMGQIEVEPGVLPLLARDLRFSMGKKDSRVRDQPEIVAGTGQSGVAAPIMRTTDRRGRVSLHMRKLGQRLWGWLQVQLPWMKTLPQMGMVPTCFPNHPLLLHQFGKRLAMCTC